MGKLDELLGVLELEPAGEGRFVAQNFAAGLGGVVFGGQLLAQTIVAGATVDPTKEVRSVHTIFARGGALDRPLDIEVEPMHVGRAMASAAVTVRQGDRLCTRSLVLLSAGEPDLIRFGAEPPAVGGPADAVPSAHGGDFWEIRVIDGGTCPTRRRWAPPSCSCGAGSPGPRPPGCSGRPSSPTPPTAS